MARTTPEDRTELARQCLDLLLELTTLLGADMAQDLRERGLTEARVPVVWALGAHGPSTQRALADRVGVSPRNITGLVDALAATGFVTRAPHPTDGRAFLVSLTTKGNAEVASLQRAYHALSGKLFASLPTEHLTDLATGLHHVVHELRPMVAAGLEPHI